MVSKSVVKLFESLDKLRESVDKLIRKMVSNSVVDPLQFIGVSLNAQLRAAFILLCVYCGYSFYADAQLQKWLNVAIYGVLFLIFLKYTIFGFDMDRERETSSQYGFLRLMFFFSFGYNITVLFNAATASRFLNVIGSFVWVLRYCIPTCEPKSLNKQQNH